MATQNQPRTPRALLLSISTAALLLLFSASTSAASSAHSSYTLKQVYSGALRLIRVDKGFEVTEKEPDIAYILFQYRSRESGKKSTRGSFEIVPQKRSVLILLKLPQMPRYHETVLMRQLLKKLRDEYGPPVRRTTPTPPKSPPDRDRSPHGKQRPGKPSAPKKRSGWF